VRNDGHPADFHQAFDGTQWPVDDDLAEIDTTEEEIDAMIAGGVEVEVVGRLITDEISADPEEVARLRRSRASAREHLTPLAADEDVYLVAARAGMSPATAQESATEEWFRAIVDTARADLLAEIAGTEEGLSEQIRLNTKMEARAQTAEAALARIRAAATEWAALAAPDDWGNDMVESVTAEVGRRVLALLDGDDHA
jgi:hypothetical protein